MAKRTYPTFASEAEEAAWLYDHRDELGDYFDPMTPDEAAQLRSELAGLQRTPPEKLAELDARVRAKTEAISLRVPIDDLKAVKAIAAQRGIGYQSLLKSFIHEAIEREQRRA
jgi:predicted DNA binding CopG/RHH family protein